MSSIVSDFSSDAEEWSFVGDGTGVSYVATGGNTGGYIEISDLVQGPTWYFSAPGKFLGDQGGMVGGSLSFDLQQSSTINQYQDEEIFLTGGGLTLIYDVGFSDHPGTTWTSYDIALAEGAGWTVQGSGDDATLADFQTVLGDLTELLIRGEYKSMGDTGGLDNVVLASPDPIIGTAEADELTGGVGDDVLRGLQGADDISGGDGDDRLRGNSGHDVLDGDDGADRLTGGAGSDLFVFTNDGDRDKITDFEDGVDLLMINGVGDLGDVLIRDKANGDVKVIFGDEVLVVSSNDVGFTAASLDENDFLFTPG